MGSLYYETAIDEIPDLKSMARINQDGGIDTWGGAYYRWSPCFNSKLFKKYMESVIEYGVEHVKLDGFHFDNSYNQACYCENCQQEFRDFLKKSFTNPREVFGITSFKNVRIPPYRQLSEVHDPLYIWWLEYRRQLCAKTHNELFSFVKAVSNDKAEVLHNPAFPRKGRTVNEIAFEPSLSPDKCDFIFAENGNFIQIKDKKLVSQVEAFKLGQKFGYKVFDSSWPLDLNGKHRNPETYEEIMRFICQSMIFGGLCGSQWIARSTKKGDMARIDIPGQLDILSNIFKYFINNLELYDENTKPYNNIKLLYYPLNCMASPEKGFKTFSDVSEKLASEGVPFSLATEEDMLKLNEEQVLILPELKYLTENLYQKVIEIAKKGCKILIIGDFGIYNENVRERDLSRILPELEKEKNIFLVNSKSNIDGEWINILRKLVFENTVIVEPCGMMVETAKDENNKLLIHILNPYNNEPLNDVNIHISGFYIKGKTKNIKLYTPESIECKSYEISYNNVDISLTGLKTMVTIALE